jgi:hypothetical protein
MYGGQLLRLVPRMRLLVLVLHSLLSGGLMGLRRRQGGHSLLL